MNVNVALIVLGLHRIPDSQEELRSAYLHAAAKWHPDRAASQGIDYSEASYRMSRVNQANNLLMGILRLRSESRLGSHYSDPYWGQHFPRDEFGYVMHDSALRNLCSLVEGLIAGSKLERKAQDRPEKNVATSKQRKRLTPHKRIGRMES